jgi:hypothetical protein
LSVRTSGPARAARRRGTRRGRRHGRRLDAQLWPQAESAAGRTSVARGAAAATGAGRARASGRRCGGPRGRRAPSARCEGRRPPRTAPVMQRLGRWVGVLPARLAPASHRLGPFCLRAVSACKQPVGPSGGPALQPRNSPKGGTRRRPPESPGCLCKVPSTVPERRLRSAPQELRLLPLECRRRNRKRRAVGTSALR